jgi:hypothetical protein
MKYIKEYEENIDEYFYTILDFEKLVKTIKRIYTEVEVTKMSKDELHIEFLFLSRKDNLDDEDVSYYVHFGIHNKVKKQEYLIYLSTYEERR